MQRTVVESGIGGQGILVTSKLMCYAGTEAGLRTMHYALYAGSVRGGVCECSVMFADGEIADPPLFAMTDDAIVMHGSAIARDLHKKVKPGGLVVVNTSIVPVSDLGRDDLQVLALPATEMAVKEMKNQMTASMIAVGAYIEATGVFSVDRLVDEVKAIIPPYRQQLVELNKTALRAGADFARSARLTVRA